MTATEFDLHIGAHKTATTYIQNVLKKSKFRPGTLYIPMWEFRSGLGREIGQKKISKLPEYIFNNDHVIISEENLSGAALGGLSLYPRAHRNLKIFNDLSGRIHVCIRKYSEFFPSCWIEGNLRKVATSPFNVKFPQRTWTDYLEEVSGALPNFKIMVWDYSDFRGNEDFYIRMISNNSIAEIGEVKTNTARVSLSHVAFDALKICAEFLDPKERAILTRRLAQKFPAGKTYPKFSPYSEDEISSMDDRYRKDLMDIDSRYGIIRPSTKVA